MCQLPLRKKNTVHCWKQCYLEKENGRYCELMVNALTVNNNVYKRNNLQIVSYLRIYLNVNKEHFLLNGR
jgi:hypothetical protein